MTPPPAAVAATVMDLERLRSRLVPVRSERPAPAAGRPAAVLVPLYVRAGAIHVVFGRRSEDVPHHKGQIAFPGGQREAEDADLTATALREAHEEIGLPPDAVQIVGELGTIVTITDFVVTPFVGIIPNDVTLAAEGREIVEVIHVPLAHLMDRAHQRQSHVTYEGAPHTIHFFDYGPHVIWGATGSILRELLDLLEAPDE